MSVVRRATARNWTVALGGAVLVGLAPSVMSVLPVDGSNRTPVELVAAAMRSDRVTHEGLAETTGTLGLPDLPRLGDLASLAGSTTRARVWWRSAQRWRVDLVTPTGETGTYAQGGILRTWDFESHESRTVVAASPLRLPRLDDLLPPQLARRILSGSAGTDRLEALPSRRVAGRSADGLRLVPPSGVSTVGHVDIWVDSVTSLPLSVSVFPRGSDQPAVGSRFLDVRMGRPGAGALTPKTPSDADTGSTTVPDLAAAVDVFAPFVLPDRLASLVRSREVVTVGGAATYGRGLARFVVLPLPRRVARSSLDAAAAGGGVTLGLEGGQGVLVSTPLLNAVVARDETAGHHRRDRLVRSYLVAGTVGGQTLSDAVEQLFLDPPPTR